MYWNMNKYHKEIYSLYKSFSYAFRGFKYAVDNERNMRIHLMVALFAIEFAQIYGLSSVEYIVLFLMFGLVITAEMINTAIEALVNLQTQSYDMLAKVAKDVAAGAVLVLAVTSVIVGGVLFLDFEKLQYSFHYIMGHPGLLVLFLVELVLAVLFVFRWNSRNMIGIKPKK